VARQCASSGEENLPPPLPCTELAFREGGLGERGARRRVVPGRRGENSPPGAALETFGVLGRSEDRDGSLAPPFLQHQMTGASAAVVCPKDNSHTLAVHSPLMLLPNPRARKPGH
jgi:hypothetical protein